VTVSRLPVVTGLDLPADAAGGSMAAREDAVMR
jgi:hypothetical protein